MLRGDGEKKKKKNRKSVADNRETLMSLMSIQKEIKMKENFVKLNI